MLLAYSTLWRDKLRPEVRVRAALFSDNSALCALRSALSALVSELIGKRFDRISAAHPPVSPCSESLSFHARFCREKADERGCRAMYFGIGRGAVTRVNTCTVSAAGLYRAGTESLSSHAPPLSGESGRARVPDDAFRDRARRSHAGQYLYGISRGAVPRRNRKARPAPAIGRFLPTANKKPRRARQRGRKDSAFVYCRIRKKTTDITSSNTRKTIVSFFRMLSRLLDLFLPA